MKIAFDHQIFTYQSYGGISRYFVNLVRELNLIGETPHVFAGLHRNQYLNQINSDAVSGKFVSSFPKKTASLFLKVNQLYADKTIRNWKPDIIHETYYKSNIKSANNKVRLTTVYDMIHELYAAQYPKSDKTTIWKKSSFQQVDHIISISYSTKKDLVELFGIDENKISVVHLGVDIKSLISSTSVPQNFDKPFLLYVGERGGYKNFLSFVTAFSNSTLLFNNFTLVAFGGGSFSNSELALFSELGLKDNQVKQISGDDALLSSLYKNATAFVYPSLYEGFGLPPLEAMAVNCPVISSNTSSMPEVIGSAAEFFNPLDVEEIKYAIERVVDSSDLQSYLIELGKENIKNFTWRECANKTKNIYRNLV